MVWDGQRWGPNRALVSKRQEAEMMGMLRTRLAEAEELPFTARSKV